MLLQFGVANFRSIRDYQELLLTASSHIKRTGKVRYVSTLREGVVPLVVLYGANASGKSTLLAAMNAMRRHVMKSHRELGATDPIPRHPFFLDGESKSKPTRFECTFTLSDSDPEENGGVYEYGFEYTFSEYSKEWLRRIVRKQRQTVQLLFERDTVDGKVNVRFGNQLRGNNRVIKNLTRPNSLFLSAAAQNNHPQLTKLYRYFAESWTVMLDVTELSEYEIPARLADGQLMEKLGNLILQADIGISGMDFANELTLKGDEDLQKFVKSPLSIREAEVIQRKRFQFTHSGAGKTPLALDYEYESRGTRVLMSLLIPALEAFTSGSLLVIDELDTSLHPRLAQAFVSLFKSDANRNGAQLVCSTHDVALIGSGRLELDEIWVADKQRDGVSIYTPLTDFQLRSRDDIEKAYRKGRLGGVPAGSDFVMERAAAAPGCHLVKANCKCIDD